MFSLLSNIAHSLVLSNVFKRGAMCLSVTEPIPGLGSQTSL